MPMMPWATIMPERKKKTVASASCFALPCLASPCTRHHRVLSSFMMLCSWVHRPLCTPQFPPRGGYPASLPWLSRRRPITRKKWPGNASSTFVNFQRPRMSNSGRPFISPDLQLTSPRARMPSFPSPFYRSVSPRDVFVAQGLPEGPSRLAARASAKKLRTKCAHPRAERARPVGLTP